MRVVTLFVLLSMWFVSACSPDLGACDMASVSTTVYLDGIPYYEGQALIRQDCAGSQCHATTAVGPARSGAPHGLNFDLDPSTKALNTFSSLADGTVRVRDEAEEIWSAIDSGFMPPPDVGQRAQLAWTDQTGTMPVAIGTLATAASRDKVRNWLACNAPVIAATTDSPQAAAAMSLGNVVAPGTPPAISPNFTSIYTNLLSGCVGCHSAGSTFTNQALDLSSKDVAYQQLVGKPAFSGAGASCGGRTLVQAGSCENSLLWVKLHAAGAVPNLCGAPMPLGGPVPSDQVRTAVCDWIKAGAMP